VYKRQILDKIIELYKRLAEIKVPSGYSSNIRSLMSIKDLGKLDWNLMIIMYWYNNYYRELYILYCRDMSVMPLSDFAFSSMQYVAR